MADLIQLLPDHIANQIAAGEVIQRPASAVKELLENSVDAGATEIRLIISEAGKSLVQVVDNGQGMSEADAVRCFQRHATSKIRAIDDLFHIRTMGFRGEALASIAAVSQVELKTRRAEDEMGTYIEIDNGQIRRKEPVACAVGTSFCMKNLFFNVPARRNFLKSNASELRHIVEEFIRVALPNPDRFFSISSNGQELMHLEKGSSRQRVVQALGSSFQSKLIPVEEHTDYLEIRGFVGKPDAARKTRGDQYLFVNGRFIRSSYLHHAIMTAYKDLIATDSFPVYVLFVTLDPAQVDVNVHPTKQEIKFEDEKIVYAFVQSAVRHALARFSVTPTLDFDLDPSIQQLEAVSRPVTEKTLERVAASPLYQAFSKSHQAHVIEPSSSNLQHWKAFFDIPSNPTQDSPPPSVSEPPAPPLLRDTPPVQLYDTYILACTDQGFLIAHQQLAHERVLYERMESAFRKPAAYQRSLFPVTLQIPPADAALLESLLADLLALGYLIEAQGDGKFQILGTPTGDAGGNEQAIIENLLEQFKHFSPDLQFTQKEKLLRSLAGQQSVKAGTPLGVAEMRHLLEDLLACREPTTTPGGNPTYVQFGKDSLDLLFRR